MEFSGWTPLNVAKNTLRADGSLVHTGRAAGLHLGAIVHAAKVASGESVAAPAGDQDGVRMQEGFMWEMIHEYISSGCPFDEAIELAFKRLQLQLRQGIVTQLALQLDGIHGTPDGLNPFGPAVWTTEEGVEVEPTGDAPCEPELESYKATRRTLRNARSGGDFENFFWTWVMQECGYLKMAGLRQVRWVVWWLAGDYSKGKGSGPQMLEARARFSQEEIDANWRGVCTIADRLEGRVV